MTDSPEPATYDDSASSDASASPRRTFIRRAGVATLGAAAAAPVVSASTAQAAGQPAYVDSSNTFTAPQTMSTRGTPPLTLVGGPSPDYTLLLRDQSSNALVARLGSIASAGSVAGVLVLHGTNGLGTYGAAWQVGVDVSVPPYDRDFYIARVNSDDTVRDVIYIWNNGNGNSPAIDLHPAGPNYPVNASVAINSQNNNQGDPPLLVLRAPSDLVGDVFTIKLITEGQPRYAIDKNGNQSWGPGGSTAPGGLSGAGGITLDTNAGSGLRISQGGSSSGILETLVLHNSRQPPTYGNGTRLAMMLDGFTFAQIDGEFGESQSGILSLRVATAQNTFVSRVTMDCNGIGFNGASPIVPPTYGSATAGSSYGANEQRMLQRVYSLLQALGFFT